MLLKIDFINLLLYFLFFIEDEVVGKRSTNMQHMAAIPRHLRSSLLLCLRRQTLALASADWGLERVQNFIVSPR